MSESSSSSGTRPTCATQTRARSSGGVRQCQLNQHRGAGAVGEQPQRQPLRVERRVGLVLPAVGGQRLPEVAGAVIQAHRDQRQSQIRRGLQVVAGQDAQAARVVRQHLGDPELHREVGDAVGHRAGRCSVAAGTTAGGSDNRSGRRPAQSSRSRNPPSSGQLVEPRRAYRAQQRDRIPAAPGSTASGRSPRRVPASACPTTTAGWSTAVRARPGVPGRWARTVNRRRAFTHHYLTDDLLPRQCSSPSDALRGALSSPVPLRCESRHDERLTERRRASPRWRRRLANFGTE